ncbi:hypothetical protein BDR05DRAFT_968993, partial [Suillus weaverae]
MPRQANLIHAASVLRHCRVKPHPARQPRPRQCRVTPTTCRVKSHPARQHFDCQCNL